MKTKSLFVLSALFFLFLTSCEQEQDDALDFYFCTTTPPTADENWTLYVDGDLVGQLPYKPAAPDCNNTAALPSMLHVVLSEERHQYEAKDAQGTVRSAGWFRYKENDNSTKKSGVDSRLGGSSFAWSCDIVIMSFFE